MKKKMVVYVIALYSIVVFSVAGCGTTQQGEQQNTIQKIVQNEQKREECSLDGCHSLQIKGSKYCSYHDSHLGKTNKPKHEDTLQAEDIITQSMIDAIVQEYEDELNAEAEKQQSESGQGSNVMTENKDSSGQSSSKYKKPTTKRKTKDTYKTLPTTTKRQKKKYNVEKARAKKRAIGQVLNMIEVVRVEREYAREHS